MKTPLQKEIWYADLEPKIGSEIGKLRPVVVVSNDIGGVLPLKWIVPITEWKAYFNDKFWILPIIPDELNNLQKASGIDVFQIKSIDKSRFQNKIGILRDEIFEKIKITINIFIDENL